MKISVSFLSSKNEVSDLLKLNGTDCDFIHVDVMDKKFVKNKNLPFKLLDYHQNVYHRKRLDVHLMVEDPEIFIKKYIRLNTECITFHVEVKKDIDYLIDLIHKHNIKAGLSIKPNTDIYSIEPFIDKIDQVLLMSVEPGKGGQEFMKSTVQRIKELKELIGSRDVKISVDGGVNKESRKYLDDADILVSGSYIINSDNYQERIDSLR